MTAMATMTNAPRVASGARPAEAPTGPVAGQRDRLRLTAACYAGMAMLVVVAFLLASVAPAVVGVPVFIVLSLGVVLLAHPTVRITHRS